jgi:hypothetical protein
MHCLQEGGTVHKGCSVLKLSIVDEFRYTARMYSSLVRVGLGNDQSEFHVSVAMSYR